ncbi:MAG: hypothetical protein ACRDIV_10070 [Ktedonobacteraceae bacterium]
MKTLIDTIPIDGLPRQIRLDARLSILIERSASNSNTVLLWDKRRHHCCELSDVIIDIVWCYNLVEKVIVVGSAYGSHLYFIDVVRLRIIQELQILREEDLSQSQLYILVTPDEKYVAVVSELIFAILNWSGDIIIDSRINMLSDRFLSLTNQSISFEDGSTSEAHTYSFTGHKE